MTLPTGRSIRLVLTTLGLAGLIVALSAVPAAATPGSNFGPTVLGRATNQSEGTLPITRGLDVVVQQNVIGAGGYSGWHSHPGGAIVIVQSGELTTYESVGNHCVVTRYIAGQAFVERPGKILNAVNTGTTTAMTIATFPNVPPGMSQRTDEPNPGTC